MTKGRCDYFVVDAFPQVDGLHFKAHAGATVGCWMPIGGVDPDTLVVKKLAHEGWQVARTLSREIVSNETYRNRPDGRGEFEQAILDGFVAHFHVRAREQISLGADSPSFLSPEEYRQFIAALGNGGYSYDSETDAQWANGVSPDGDEFLPLWATESSANMWQECWPDYTLRHVVLDELQGTEGILEIVNSADMWIAICSNDSLFTMHPLSVEFDLRSVQESVR